MSSRFLAIITILLLAAALAFSTVNRHRRPHPLAYPLSSIPWEISGWSGADDPPIGARIEASLSATSYLVRTYTRGSKSMNLFIAYYRQERAGESMHSPKHCLRGSGWEMLETRLVTVPFGEAAVPINCVLLYNSGSRARILYWYQAPRRVLADEYMSKAYLIWDAIRYGETSGSIVRLTLSSGSDALEDGVAFARELLPQVDRCLSQPRPNARP